jgi:hypothetical protein
LVLSALSSLAWAEPGAAVVDSARLFSDQAKHKADQAILAIHDRHQRDLRIETFERVPDEERPALERQGKAAFFADWASRRGKAANVNGLFVLVCMSPGRVEVVTAGNGASAVFTRKDQDELGNGFAQELGKKHFDGALDTAVGYVAWRMDANEPGRAAEAAGNPLAVNNALGGNPVAAVAPGGPTAKAADTVGIVFDLHGYFTQGAKDKAEEGIRAIRSRYQRDLRIETVDGVPDDERPALERLGEAQFFADWAVRRAKYAKVNGVIMLIAADSGHVQVSVVGDRVPITQKDADDLCHLFVSKVAPVVGANGFDKAQQERNDQALVEAVAIVAKRMDVNTRPGVAMGRPDDNPVPAGPDAPAVQTAATDAPAGYQVVASTQSGQSLVTQKNKVDSVQAALESTFPDLARYFGERPVPKKAYWEKNNPSMGGATFSAHSHGHPIGGWISCMLDGAGGAKVTVVYGSVDASKSEWKNLLNPAAVTGSPSVAASPAEPDIPLKQFDFPDGTGSVGLAEGWMIKAKSAVDDSIVISGPAGQTVILKWVHSVYPPGSSLINFLNSNRVPYLVSQRVDPFDILKTITPQIPAVEKSPPCRIDSVISREKAGPNRDGGDAILVDYTYTLQQNGTLTQYRKKMHLESAPFPSFSGIAPSEAYRLDESGSVAAPIAIYQRDLPAMCAIARSFKVDQQKAEEVFTARLTAGRKALQMAHAQFVEAQATFARMDQIRYQYGEASEARIQQSNAANLQRMADKSVQDQQRAVDQRAETDSRTRTEFKRQLDQSRASADLQELVSGQGTFRDTQTGGVGYADLHEVGPVVAHLNEAVLDPNRFQVFPLRDQLYPLPGQ